MMGRVRCIICGEKIPPEDLYSFRGEPLCLKHSNLIAGEIDRLREAHKNTSEIPATEEERLDRWAKNLGSALTKQREIKGLDTDKKEVDLAFEAIRRIDNAIESLGFGIIFDKIDPSTLRLLYLKLDELECCANRSKKPIVGALTNQAKSGLR